MSHPINPVEHVGKRVYWKCPCSSNTIVSAVVSNPPIDESTRHLLRIELCQTKYPDQDWVDTFGNPNAQTFSGTDFYLNPEDVSF